MEWELTAGAAFGQVVDSLATQVDARPSDFVVGSPSPVAGREHKLAHMDVHLGKGDARAWHLFIKRIETDNELRALDAVAGVPLPNGRVPRVIARGEADHLHYTHWFVYEALPGAAPVESPGLAFDTMARVHIYYYEDVANLDGFRVMDRGDWRGLCASTATRLKDLGDRIPVALWAAKRVDSWAENEAMLDATAMLPQTLLHADLNYSNILVADDKTAIIDWELSAIGQPLRDIVDVSQDGMESANMRSYLDAWEYHGGPKWEPRQFELAWWHAKAYANCLYLPYYIARDAEKVRRDVHDGTAAIARMEELLGQR